MTLQSVAIAIPGPWQTGHKPLLTMRVSEWKEHEPRERGLWTLTGSALSQMCDPEPVPQFPWATVPHPCGEKTERGDVPPLSNTA